MFRIPVPVADATHRARWRPADEACVEAIVSVGGNELGTRLWRRIRGALDDSASVLAEMFIVIGGTMLAVVLWAAWVLLGRRTDPTRQRD